MDIVLLVLLVLLMAAMPVISYFLIIFRGRKLSRRKQTCADAKFGVAITIGWLVLLTLFFVLVSTVY